MRSLTPAAAIAAAIALAGCGGLAAHHPRPAAIPTYADPDCTAVLGQLPPGAPSSAGASITLLKELDGITAKGSTLNGLTSGLQADLLSLSFAQSGSGGTSAALSKYDADAAQIRRYCAG